MTGFFRLSGASLVLVVLIATQGQASGTSPTSGAVAAQPHVVIAVIEDAVNVYHKDFAAPGTQSPVSRIRNYPTNSKPLRLHLDAPDFPTARHADDAVWASVKPSQLYYIPGTRLSGLIYLPSPLDRATKQVAVQYPPPVDPPRPIIDGYTWHGTSVASIAAGTKYGACPNCDIVIVAAENEEDGLAWAAKQSWIDVINNSWGGPLGIPTRATAGHPERAIPTTASPGGRAAAASGKAVVFASGNGITGLGATTRGTQHSLTWNNPYTGPPWVLTVGASKASTGQPTDWHNIPVDVIAQGEQRPAADSSSLTGETTFTGTSASAPIVSGILAESLFQARVAAHDTHSGAIKGKLLRLSSQTIGTHENSRTYTDLFAAARAVAAWRTFDPASVATDPYQLFVTPTTPLAYAYQGYGNLDRSDVPKIRDILLGRLPLPKRPEMAEWTSLADSIRTATWGARP